MRYILSLTLVMVLAVAPLRAAESPKRAVPLKEAQRIAHQLFPEVCGVQPPGCRILLNAPTNFPFAIAIVFPEELRSPVVPRVVWVSLDERLRVIGVTGVKKEACSNS